LSALARSANAPTCTEKRPCGGVADAIFAGATSRAPASPARSRGFFSRASRRLRRGRLLGRDLVALLARPAAVGDPAQPAAPPLGELLVRVGRELGALGEARRLRRRPRPAR
jgi:hypothetical protein